MGTSVATIITIHGISQYVLQTIRYTKDTACHDTAAMYTSPVGCPAGPAMLVHLTFVSKHTIVASQSQYLTPTVNQSINCNQNRLIN